jgi:hypothetical protein
MVIRILLGKSGVSAGAHEPAPGATVIAQRPAAGAAQVAAVAALPGARAGVVGSAIVSTGVAVTVAAARAGYGELSSGAVEAGLVAVGV